MNPQHFFCCLTVGLVTVLALASAPVSAGDLTPLWIERYDTPDSRKDESADVVTDAQGNIYVTGSAGFGALSTWDVLTVSYDAAGNLRWVDQYDGGSQDLGYRLTFDAGGDLLALGRSNGNFLVVRYDPATGSRLDSFEYDASGTDDPRAFVTDASGAIYITGSSWPAGADNQNDYFTVKLDATGHRIWSQRYNGPGAFLFAHDVPSAIGLDANGDVIVTGYSNAPGSATGDFYTIKYDGDDGTELWADRYSAGSNEGGNDLAIAPGGDVLVTGGSFQSGFKYVTLRYDGATGNVEWVETRAPAACSVATRIVLDGQGDAFVTGWADPDCDESNFNENIVTEKYRGTDGALLWTQSFGENGVGFFDVPSDLALDRAGQPVITGETTGLLVVLVYDAASGEITASDTVAGDANEIAGGRALTAGANGRLVVTGMARNVNTEARDYLTLAYPGAAPVTIFADGFESGDLSHWSGVVAN
jgi:hypothetical protein